MTVKWTIRNGEITVSFFDTKEEAIDWYFRLRNIVSAGVFCEGGRWVVKYVGKATEEEKRRAIESHYPDEVDIE